MEGARWGPARVERKEETTEESVTSSLEKEGAGGVMQSRGRTGFPEEPLSQPRREGAGGPDDLEMRAIDFKKEDCPSFAEVIDRSSSLRFAPMGEGDRRVVSLLGGADPEELYLAPIASGKNVIALLYGDAGDRSVTSAETAALDVVLHHAGLALDRAVLERALAEIESESA